MDFFQKAMTFINFTSFFNEKHDKIMNERIVSRKKNFKAIMACWMGKAQMFRVSKAADTVTGFVFACG